MIADFFIDRVMRPVSRIYLWTLVYWAAIDDWFYRKFNKEDQS